MSRLSAWKVALVLAIAAGSSLVMAQAPPTPYGAPVGIDDAKKAAAAAIAAAVKLNVFDAIAVVDPAGLLVYFEKMDGTQNGSVDVSIDKARSAALFKRPSKFFLDNVGRGGEGLRFLAMRGAVPNDGGLPLVQGGKIVGAIGVSGGTGEQDAQCAKAGVDAIAK